MNKLPIDNSTIPFDADNIDNGGTKRDYELLDNNFYEYKLKVSITMKKHPPALLSNAEFAANLTKKYIETIDIAEKKKDGQVFTPIEIANYMAKMIDLPLTNFTLLDPSAGTGILLSAMCDRVYNENIIPVTIEITAYETDEKIIPCLKSCLEYCKNKLSEKKHRVHYSIIPLDFIDCNIQSLKTAPDNNSRYPVSYNIIIANPPYQKLPASSKLRDLLPDIIFGRTNLYSIFIALGISLLNEKGQFVFFTPRSYCSGQYHKKIRELLLNNSCIKTIHSFGSRHNIFEEHDVLQEVIILHGVKDQGKKCSPIDLHFTQNQFLDNIQSLTVPYSYVVPQKNPISNIHILQTKNDMKIIDIVQSWEYTLEDLGFKISTGKVVDFRIKKYLRDKSDGYSTVPLLWMQHLKNGKIEWPFSKFKKEQYIISCEATKEKLVPVQNYVLLRRFSPKDEERRVQAFPFIAEQFSAYQNIGFENHVNYLFRLGGLLSSEETYGFAAFFNSTLIDRYYRILSGNTQVNSSDIMNLPFPDLQTIIEVGHYSIKNIHNPNRRDLLINDLLEKS